MAGPETGAAHLVRVGFARNRIGEPRHRRMERRAPSREACDCQVETAPEKVHGACFAEEAAAEELEDAIGLHENAPERVRRTGIIGGMYPVLGEGNRIRHLARYF